MQVHHAVRIGAGRMDRAVQRKACHVDGMDGFADHLASAVDLDEIDARISSKAKPNGLIRK
jgi:hypothetical protein